MLGVPFKAQRDSTSGPAGQLGHVLNTVPPTYEIDVGVDNLPTPFPGREGEEHMTFSE